LASLYFLNNLNNKSIENMAKKALKGNSAVFIPIFIYIVASILTMDGYQYDSEDGFVKAIEYKYLNNFLEMLPVLIGFLVGIASLLFGIFIALFKNSKKGIWFAGLGTVIFVTSIFMVAGLNNTIFYFSISDLQSSLNIENSSGSHYTLTVMSYASLLIPFVVAYIYFVWRAMDREELSIDEVESDPHHY
jgi:cytochrome d ubiquinol oxidase subunit II